MKERGIIFGAESVRAILEGRKRQTRRAVKPQPSSPEWLGYMMIGPGKATLCGSDYPDSDKDEVTSPYQPGQRLWVKEAYSEDGMHFYPHLAATYKADGGIEIEDGKAYSPESKSWHRFQWKSPLFMPRWASRLTLEVTEVRVERLQEISEKDAKAEGCSSRSYRDGRGDESARLEYRRNWESINGKKHPWESNPWVWAITFKRMEA